MTTTSGLTPLRKTQMAMESVSQRENAASTDVGISVGC